MTGSQFFSLSIAFSFSLSFLSFSSFVSATSLFMFVYYNSRILLL